MPTERALRIADAAITTLAAEGMRGLTHRAVDRTAGLPEGSTSYYFRTRIELIFATLLRMADLDATDVGDLPLLGGTLDLDELTDQVTALIHHWVTEGRSRTLARYELALEATRRSELRDKMVEHGTRFRAMAHRMVAAVGVSEPERRGDALVAFVDGLVYHQIAGSARMAEDDLRAACRDMLATVLRPA